MAAVYGIKRKPIGKVVPHISGSNAAFDGGRRRLGLFVSESMAIAAIMNCADKPLEVDGYLVWVEAMIAEEGDQSPRSADFDVPAQDGHVATAVLAISRTSLHDQGFEVNRTPSGRAASETDPPDVTRTSI